MRRPPPAAMDAAVESARACASLASSRVIEGAPMSPAQFSRPPFAIALADGLPASHAAPHRSPTPHTCTS